MNIFAENSWFNRFFGFLGTLIALNWLWIICSIPILTMGTSTTALYYCMLKLRKEGDCRVVHDFFKSFKQNFRQSMIVWVGILVCAVILWMDSRIITYMSQSMGQMMRYLLYGVTAVLVLIAMYLFPVLSAFENKISKLVTNAFYFIFKNLVYTVAVAVITIVPIVFTIKVPSAFGILLFVWLCCGFSLTAYGASWFFWKLFVPFLGEAEDLSELEEEI